MNAGLLPSEVTPQTSQGVLRRPAGPHNGATHPRHPHPSLTPAKKVVETQDPASFNINITFKSRPDLLAYFCQESAPWGSREVSTKLQMYWELWTSSECTVGGGGGAGAASGAGRQEGGDSTGWPPLRLL